MTTLPEIPRPPEAPEPRPYSYDRWRPQEELVGLARWLREVDDYVCAPQHEHYARLTAAAEDFSAQLDIPQRVVAMPMLTWQTVERKARAFDALVPMVGRLLYFLEGQERAMRDVADHIRGQSVWRVR